MNILLLVKQVPNTENIKLSAGQMLELDRLGLPMQTNIFDRYIIEEAKRIQEKYPDEDIKVIALTFGDEGAKRSVVEAMSISADVGYAIVDDRLKGSDSIATAKIFESAIRLIEKQEGKIDLILTGRQSSDGSTGQTGVILAERLGANLVASAVEVCSIDFFDKTNTSEAKAKAIITTKRTLNGFVDVEMDCPVVVTMTKPEHETRFPTFKRIRWANAEVINELRLEELEGFGLKKDEVGKDNSNTSVIFVKKPGRNAKNAIVYCDDFDEGYLAADKLIEMLEEDKILKW